MREIMPKTNNGGVIMDIKFRYVFKHKKDGDYQFGVFTINEIENGDAIKDIGYMANDGYILVSRDRYTDLKDKNGKEIYEGDIFITGPGFVAAVEWEKEGRFLGFTVDGKRKIVYVNREPVVEVIGNVYEDGDLLGGAVND